MLIATQSAVYHTAPGRPFASPRAVLENERILRVAEGGRYDVLALGGGVVMVLHDCEPVLTHSTVEEPIESLLVVNEHPLEVLIGTEGAHLYRFTHLHARRIEAFDELAVRRNWRTPWGGPPAVRSLAMTSDGWLYADIHVGGIMRSPDGGATWEPVGAGIDEDVHQVAVCPAAPNRVYANTASAVYVSEDRGRTWAHRGGPLGSRYGRCIAVSATWPDLILASTSDGPRGDDLHGGLFRSDDAGRTWRHIAEGFPDSTRRNIDTHHVTFSPDGLAWACVEDGLYVGRSEAREWELFWQAPQPILMLHGRGQLIPEPAEVSETSLIG